MKNHRRTALIAQSEAVAAEAIGEELPPTEARHRIEQHLSRFFQDRGHLHSAVQNGMLINEFCLCRRLEKESDWFLPAIDAILSICWQAKKRGRDVALKLMRECYTQHIAPAIRNARDAFYLQPILDFEDEDTPLLAKACFREIGDLLEGSLKPFTQVVMKLHVLAEGSSDDLADIDSMPFGQITSRLATLSTLKCIYVPEPWGLPLNQWRNIAAHNSYAVVDSDGTVTCEYGAKTRHEIKLSCAELRSLSLELGDITHLHKVALTFFGIDNIDSMRGIPHKTDEHSVSAIVLSALKLAGLDVLDSSPWNGKVGVWKLELLDPHDRSKVELIESLRQPAAIYASLVPDSSLVVKVRNTEGRTIVDGSLTYGKKPIHAASPPVGSTSNTETRRVRRNAPCPCGSGRKYKMCCLRKT